MNVSPTPVIAGTSRAFSVAIKNTSNISLGSINLTVPPLLTITAASASKGTVTRPGNLVQVRTVGLGAGKSMTITVNAVAPCKTTTLTWYVMAMSGSNYTGTTFALDTAKSTKTTKVNGTCTLAFVAGRQPGSAHPNEVISSVDFDPSGAPIQVKVLDGSGNPSSFPASIALAIGSNPGGGTLGGTPTKTASGGIASFDDLTIDNPGVDYTLVASSTGFTSVTSGPFTIADLDVPCEPNVDCIGDIDDGTTFANVNAKADPSATNLRISLLEGGPDCDGDDYIESTSTVEFSVSSGSRVKEVSIASTPGSAGRSKGPTRRAFPGLLRVAHAVHGPSRGVGDDRAASRLRRVHAGIHGTRACSAASRAATTRARGSPSRSWRRPATRRVASDRLIEGSRRAREGPA